MDFKGPWDKTQESLLAEEEEFDFYHLFPALESDRYHLLDLEESWDDVQPKSTQTKNCKLNKVHTKQQKEGKKRKKKKTDINARS